MLRAFSFPGLDTDRSEKRTPRTGVTTPGSPPQQCNPQTTSTMPQAPLPQGVRAMIGEAGVEEQPRTPELHPTLSSVWSAISHFGLSEEDSHLLASRNPVPPHCPFLELPKVNPAVWELMDPQSRESDTRIVRKQRFIAAALAGIGATISPYLEDSNEADLSFLFSYCYKYFKHLRNVLFGGVAIYNYTIERTLVKFNYNYIRDSPK